MSKNLLIERYVSAIRLQAGYNSNLPITLNGTNGNLTVSGNGTIAGNLTVTGTIAGGAESVTAQTITSSSANAFAVGPAGTTNPSFNVDASTASAATGLNIKSAAAGGGVALSVITSGTNEALKVDGAGSGTVGINTTSTTAGLVTIGNSTSLAGLAVNGPLTSGAQTITSASANATAVGPNGTTNPTLKIDSSTASSATGVSIKSSAAGGGVTLAAISSAGAENLILNSKGAANIVMNTAGAIISSNSSTALEVGANGATNPAFVVDTSTASIATGFNVKGAAAGAGLALSVISSGGAENLTVAAKGTTGTITFNPAITATAGGAAADGIMFGSLGVGVFTGTGTPTFSAMNGSLYVDSNATTTTTRLYVNKSGAGTAGTTWTNFTAAA